MTALLEKIDRELTERREKAETAYQILVVQIADGSSVGTADEVSAILTVAEKTQADLRNAVARLNRRRDLKRQADEGAQAEERVVEVKQQIEAAARKLAEAQSLYTTEVRPLEYELAQLREIASRGQDATRRLRDDADPQLNRRQKVLAMQMDQLEQHRKALTDAAERKQAAIDQLAGSQDRGDMERVAAMRAGLANIQSQLDESLTKVQALADESNRLAREDALIP